MKRNISGIFAFGLLAFTIPAVFGQTGAIPSAPATPPTDYSKIFKDDKEKISYALGMFYGNPVKGFLSQYSNDVDIAVLEKTMTEEIKGEPMRITPQQENEILTAYSIQLRFQLSAKQRKQAEEGEAFLATNKNAPGVITLTNGLQYRILTKGTGPRPEASDIVSVNYTEKLVDGTIFDSSAKHGGPAEFAVNKVIPGWSQALQMMPVGSKWELFIPSSLAYGEKGSQPLIGPNAMLTFEVELISTKPSPLPGPASTTGSMTSDIIKVPSAEGLKHGEKIETIKASDVEKATKTNN